MAKPPVVERPYETLFLCPVETPQKTIDAFVEKVKTTLAAEKAVLRGVQNWGRRRLAYPIKRHKDGVYIYIDFDGSNKSAEALNGLFRVTDFVLRHLTCEREESPVIAAPASAVAPADGSVAPAAAPAAAAPISPTESKESPSQK